MAAGRTRYSRCALLIAAAWGFAAAILPASALANPADRGADLYRANCMRCHGPTAQDAPAGDIRRLSRSTVTGAVRGGPGRMPTFALTDEDIGAILAWLERL